MHCMRRIIQWYRGASSNPELPNSVSDEPCTKWDQPGKIATEIPKISCNIAASRWSVSWTRHGSCHHQQACNLPPILIKPDICMCWRCPCPAPGNPSWWDLQSSSWLLWSQAAEGRKNSGYRTEFKQKNVSVAKPTHVSKQIWTV